MEHEKLILRCLELLLGYLLNYYTVGGSITRVGCKEIEHLLGEVRRAVKDKSGANK